jgi:hypothetical protein
MTEGPWYYADHNGTRFGPVPTGQLLQAILSGSLSARTLEWSRAQPDWRPARDIPEIKSHLTRTPGRFLERSLVCAACSSEFVWSAGEQAFFATHRLSPPKRCKPCSQKRNAQEKRAKRPAHVISGGLPTLGKRR